MWVVVFGCVYDAYYCHSIMHVSLFLFGKSCSINNVLIECHSYTNVGVCEG